MRAATDTVIIAAAVAAALYFGREVLVPIALAVLLSFVLAPVVMTLSRLRIGKVASVLATVIVAFGLLGGLGAIIGRQLSVLAENLPQYQVVIEKKLATLGSSDFGRGVVEKAADAIEGLDTKLAKPSAPAPAASRPGQIARSTDSTVHTCRSP